MEKKNINLTPNPRILQMLGQIDFDNWQCMAELIDNSIDALLKDFLINGSYDGQIWVDIPKQSEYTIKPITIWDNGPGMNIEQLENALKAGFSGNDPMSNLGLFGMGFNIATARLGDRTTVYSSMKGDKEEIGVEIDFKDMIKNNSFDRPVITRSKDNSYSSGTTIKISKLNERVKSLGQQGLTSLRRNLTRVYSKLLRDYNINIFINGEKLIPNKKCNWDPSRYVFRNGEKIYSYIEINKDLGSLYFCDDCWSWLDTNVIEGETPICKICGSADHVHVRKRKIKGWIGVQRYYDKDNFGIDIYRNGRLIVSNDKSFFYWINPETDESELEYPIDATHWGGRIIGEIEANFLKVNYTKDSFEKGDKSWGLLLKELRGEGPIRPNIAKEKGYEDNTSPISRLFKGYRKGNKPGFEDLLPGKYNYKYNKWEGNNVEPKAWAELFEKGELEYQSDKKWWELVVQVEEDRRISNSSVNDDKSWDPIEPTETVYSNDYNNIIESDASSSDQIEDSKDSNTDNDEDDIRINTQIINCQSTLDDTGEQYQKDEELSNIYELEELGEEGIIVDVYMRYDLPNEKPLILNKLSHSNFKAYYNPNSCFFSKYSNSVKEILLMELANNLYLRRADQEEWPISRIFYLLKAIYCKEDILELDDIRERVNILLHDIRITLSNSEFAFENEMNLDKNEYKTLQRAVLSKLGEGDSKVKNMLKTTEFLSYMPNNYIKRFFKKCPNLFFDGKVWKKPYEEISDEDIRNEIVEEYLSYLSDITWFIEHEDEEIINNMYKYKRNIGSLKALEEFTNV